MMDSYLHNRRCEYLESHKSPKVQTYSILKYNHLWAYYSLQGPEILYVDNSILKTMPNFDTVFFTKSI
jgi:hypothetical protein